MSIELKITGETAEDFQRNLVMFGQAFLHVNEKGATAVSPVEVMQPAPEEPDAEPAPEQPEEKAEAPAARMYGQSGKGSGRRTKAEIAEDEEIDRLIKELGGHWTAPSANTPAAELLDQLRKVKDEQDAEPEQKPQISESPEDRKDPEEVPDAAPQEPDETPAAEATRDDLKAAMSRYVEKFGMAAAKEKLPGVMGYQRQSEVPDDPAEFAAVIAKIDEAIGG